MTLFKKFVKNDDGAVTVEAAFISAIMISLTIAAFEMCYGFFQWNTAQQAARMGARIAATSSPVASEISTMTGLSGSAEPGDPMPDYAFSCDGGAQNCSSGGFNNQALRRIVFGPDNDGVCGSTDRARQGMCDVFDRVGPENVTVEYKASGLGRAGNPGVPAPLITVTIKNVDFDFAILRYLTPSNIRKMPDVSVTVMSEDMKSGV